MDEDDQMMPVPTQGMEVRTRGSEVFTARRVEVRRSLERVLRDMALIAQQAGEAYYYSLPFWDNKKRETTFVEGPSINLALDLARVYGNCVVSCDHIIEEAGYWFFHARFTDLETGYSLVSVYRQRRDQKTGMERKDEGRHQDMVFRIGYNKAIRNVIVDALRSLANRMFEEAKNSQLSRIEKNPEAARSALLKAISNVGGDVKQVETAVGRSAKNWTPNDMAGIYARVRAVMDQQVAFDDVFPSEAKEAAKEQTAAPKMQAEPEKKPAAKAKKAAAPKEEPKDDAEEKQEAGQKAAEQKTAEPEIPPELDRRQKEEAPEPAAEEDEIDEGLGDADDDGVVHEDEDGQENKGSLFGDD